MEWNPTSRTHRARRAAEILSLLVEVKSMNEKLCGQKAVRRFTWPGQDESFICQKHLPKLMGVAAAMGMHLQLIQLADDTDETCKQKSSS